VNVNRTKTQLATLKKDKVNYLVGGNFDWKIKTSSGETVIPSIVYVNTGSVDLKNDTLVYLWWSSSTPSTPPVVQDPEFTGNCLVDLKPADVDALNSVFVKPWLRYEYGPHMWEFDHNLTKEEWCSITLIEAYWENLWVLPRGFWKLYGITSLDFVNAGMPTLPDSFWYLKNLEYLVIMDSGLTSIPASFGNLTKLKNLTLSWNWLTDLPKEFTQLVNLENILLQDNDLTYEAFWENNLYKFDSLTKVHYIDLRNNPSLRTLADLYSSSISLTNFEQFYYSGNDFSITSNWNNSPIEFIWSKRTY
jgi:hypothetical protein